MRAQFLAQVSIEQLFHGRLGILIALAVLFLISAGVLSYRLTDPWIGHHDYNGAFYSLAARNYLQYGYGGTRFGMVINSDVASPEQFVYYTHHPPLLPLLVSFSFAVLGLHEWAARVVPVIFSLGSVGLVYLLGSDMGG